MGKKHKEFQNPPVIEAWIEFEIDLTEESVPWGEDAAKELIRKCFPEFKAVDFFGLAKVTVDSKTRKILETGVSFERVRAFTETRDRCIQAGRNVLVFNQIKKDTWPSFEERRDQALDALAKYMAFRQLNKLRTVALHYKDVVQIPRGDTNEIRLENYFTVCPRVPEDKFGALSHFTFTLNLPDFCKPASIILSMQNVPSSETHYRFVMDWHLTPKQEITDADTGKKWLDDAHDVNLDAFISAFTEKGLALFS
jgi:uncharacterized protein (TIGR04255 family)